MKRQPAIFLLVLIVALAALACNLPTMVPSTGGELGTGTPGTPLTNATQVTTTPGAANTSAPGTPAPTGSGGCTYKVTFIGDITVPDGTVMKPGQSFTKTWRVRNDGTCVWGPTGHDLHAIAFTSGDQMSAPKQVSLPGVVDPGQTADVSVSMVAPTTPGNYIGYWMFRVDVGSSGTGQFVGIGSTGNQPLYVSIKVQ